MAATLLTPEQAAQRLNADGVIKASWLRDQATAGKIPHTKIAEKIMFTEQHCDEIVQIFERRPLRAPAAATTKAAPRRKPKPQADTPASTTRREVVQLRARPPKRRVAAS